MKINIKNISYKINSMVVMIILGILFSAGITFAAAVWQGTGWITNGSVISAGKIKTNFDYLYEQIQNTSSLYYSGGNVGIGTTVPSYKLDVNGTGRFAGNLTLSAINPSIISGGSYITIPNGLYISGGTPYFQTQIQARGGIHNDSATYLTLTGGTSGITYFSGNVGIGTTYPSNKLEVAGNIEANGYCDRNGQNCKTASQLGGGGYSFGGMYSTGSNCANLGGPCNRVNPITGTYGCPAGYKSSVIYMDSFSSWDNTNSYIHMCWK